MVIDKRWLMDDELAVVAHTHAINDVCLPVPKREALLFPVTHSHCNHNIDGIDFARADETRPGPRPGPSAAFHLHSVSASLT